WRCAVEQKRATLTIPEVAELLGICRASAYQIANDGRLPGVLRLGRRLVVSRKAIEEFLERGGSGSEDSPSG
ncbi:MAG: helix-turn-helix domain-containing protein, partial [Chloroflexi bacterium]|nr:helix-turn-helix domain-containing protein [Chloroflexota bacterium]